MSWLLPSWIGSGLAPAPASAPVAPTPPPSDSHRPRRFPPPPSLHSTGSASPEDRRKRERGWIPRSSSFGTGTGEDVLEPAMSGMRAEGAFDTPRSYESMARAGVSPARESDELAEEEPPHKKRKGLVGTTLSLALDGAIFGSSVAYSAYQLWKNPPTVGDDIDAHLARNSAKSSVQNSPLVDAPPPYTEDPPTSGLSADDSTSTHLSSQMPRRVRHAHAPRPRSSHPRRSFPPPSSCSSASSSHAPTPSTSNLPRSTSLSYDPFSYLRLPHELPQFHPMDEEDASVTGDEDEDDAEMQVVAARLKELIETGTEALASRPSWDFPTEDQEALAPLPTISVPSTSSSRPFTNRPSSSFLPVPSSFASPRRSLPGPSTPSSASRHARRHSDFTGGPSPTKLPMPRSANHTPRSSRGGSLAGVPGEGFGLTPLGRLKAETGAQAFEGSSERHGRRSSEGGAQSKGWWEH